MNLHRLSLRVAVVLATVLATPVAIAGEPIAVVRRQADLAWAQAQPPLPPEVKVTVLAGDPSQPGPFTLRLLIPASFCIPPHVHPASEHCTIIKGRMAVGEGERFDESTLQWVMRGDFFSVRAGEPHFGLTKTETILEIDAVGPWGLTWVGPDAPATGAR